MNKHVEVKKVFDFIYARLINVHGENPNYDYMLNFKKSLTYAIECIKELRDANEHINNQKFLLEKKGQELQELRKENEELKNVAKSASNISEKQMYELASLKDRVDEGKNIIKINQALNRLGSPTCNYNKSIEAYEYKKIINDVYEILIGKIKN